MKKLLLPFFAFLFSLNINAQDFSNKGKDFWVGYGYHQQMTNGGGGGSQDMVLYFATEQVTNITISVPGTGYVQSLTSGPGNSIVTSAPIPKTGVSDARLLIDGLSNKGIHVTSDKPMVAYAHVYNQSVSGATILFPTSTLGREYYSVNYKNWSNTVNSNCWFYVVAADTGTTTLEITPTGNTTGGWLAGTTHTVSLTQGQVYNVMGSLIVNSGCGGTNQPPCTSYDLTGSFVKSVNTGSGCKKIAVFSGSGRISITCTNFASSSDNYMVQAMPKTAWGKKYLTVPANGNQAFNIYRVCVTDPTTVVKVNGVVTALPLQGNFYYEIPQTNLPIMVEGDKPIMVAQYFTSQNACGNGSPGDPEVIYLSAVEQNINKVLWNATPNWAISSHNFNVILPNSGTAVSSFTLDGATVAGFIVHPQDPNYVYLKMAVSQGFHVIQSDSGFNAIAYGFGNAESYGYNAGTNIKDLYQQIGVVTQYGIEPSPSVCTNSPFKFKVSLPYVPDSMFWNFHGIAGMFPNNNNVMVDNTGNIAEDSSTVVNGKVIHWYSLPTLYSFTTGGVYPITITTYVPNADCGSIQDIDFDLTVSAPPTANFTFSSPRCMAESVQFTETTPQSPKPTYNWYWNFDDAGSGAANTSALRNPVHIFSSPGPHNVRFSGITTPGCVLDTVTLPIIIAPLPTATISGTTAVCLNSAPPSVTFTGAGGTAPYTFTYNINGGPNQFVTTTVGNSVTVTAPTNIAGTFNYNLVSVQNTGSALCQQPQSGTVVIIVNPLPTGVINGNTTVCLNAPSPLVTFTGASGSAPYTFTYNINGGPAQTITTTSGNAVTLAAPTNVAGTFTYTLTFVQDINGPLCGQSQSATTVITVSPFPTATITGNIAVCRNAASPNVTFTGALGIAPYTFTYNINGGPTQTVTTSTGNSVTVAVPTSTVGVFTYNLLTVKEGSAQACTQPQTGSVVVTVNPLPTATISGAISVCQNAPSPDVTFTGSAATAPYTFTYNINGGPNLTITTTVGNSVTVAAPTNVVGTFTYNLVSVRDASTTTCSQAQTGSTLITIRALPTATINGTIAVCLNAPSPSITFTGATGTAPYTFTYNINGGAPLTVSTTVGNSVTVTVPTNTVGTFTYNLVSVQEGSGLTCNQVQTGSAIVTVNPLPTASISGTTEVCLNSSPSPLVTFTGAGSLAPYTFTYNINGGSNQTVTTTVGNSVTVIVPTNVAGTFVYNLLSVRDASSTLCTQAQTGSATFIINPLPTANFSASTPACSTGDVSFTNLSTPNAGIINEWTWNFGDPSSGAANTSNIASPIHNFAAAGSYQVSLIVKTDKGCTSTNPPRTIVINSRPKAGFIDPQVCLSDTYASFTDTSAVAGGAIVAWQWNFDDPGSGALNTSTLQNPTHSYSTVGTKNVQLIATSNSGCKDTTIQSFVVNGDIPIANFTVNNAGGLCANDSVRITNTSTVNVGSIIRIEIYWDNAGAPATFETFLNPASGAVFVHKYPTTTTTRNYSIRYRVYSGATCVDDKTRVVVVNAAPSVLFNPIPNTCLNVAPFQVTQATETGGVSGSFAFTGPGITTTGMFDPLLVGPGTYRIYYKYTSSMGCIDTASQTITVLTAPVADFTKGSPACEKETLTFSDNSSSIVGSLITWTWNFGDGSPVVVLNNGNPFTHTFRGAGTYTVTLVVTTSDGCRSIPKPMTVIVSPQPKPDFSFPVTACLPNATVNFSDASTIADGTQSSFTYLWDFGDPLNSSNTSTAKNPSHIYTAIGPYNVKLQVRSGAGCIHDTTIVVNTIHPRPIADFDFSKPSVCIADDVSFIDRSNGLDGSLNSWNWRFGDGGISSLPSPTHIYGGIGRYDVKLYVSNSQGCTSDTVTKVFNVYPYPSVNAGPDLFVLEGGSTVITPIVTGDDILYLWLPNQYLNNNRSNLPVTTPTQDITYTLTVTSRGGCSSSDQVFIKVLKGPEIPNTFTPNNDKINDFWVIKYLETYPDNRVQVFTRTGQLVFESRGYRKPWDGNMNGKSLPVDTYYYIIEPGNGRKPLTGYVTIIK
ncbi:MAG: PKD domain-containing protein [Ferruginibacter sp.]